MKNIFFQCWHFLARMLFPLQDIFFLKSPLHPPPPPPSFSGKVILILVYYAGQNCSGFTFYYTTTKQANEPQLYLSLFERC